MIRHVVALLAVFAAGWVGAAEAPPPLPPTIGPYLQNPAPDAMTICYLAQGTGVVEVLYGAVRPDTPCMAASVSIPGTPWTIWKARIQGLRPGSTCAYRVLLREGAHAVADTTASFRTLDPGAGQMRMILLNDLHNRVPTLEALMQHVTAEDFGMSLLLGDCWTDPRPANGAEAVFRTLDAYVRLLDAARKPMLLVRGNHETRGGFAGRMAYLFDIPGLHADAAADEQLWPFMFRAGPAFFIAMDTGEDDGFGTDENSYKRPQFWQSYRRRQEPWLKDALSAAQTDGAPWKIFLSHIPLYNTVPWNSEPSRVYWEPLLRDAGLAVMLAGHDHTWKLVPAGEVIQRVKKHKDGTSTALEMTPPCPVLIGGGPSSREGTVMKFEATAQTLHVRLFDAGGQLLTELEETR